MSRFTETQKSILFALGALDGILALILIVAWYSPDLRF